MEKSAGVDRKDVAKRLRKCEEALLAAHSLINNERELKERKPGEFSGLTKELLERFKDFQKIVVMFNRMDSDELPFGLFKGKDYAKMQDIQLKTLGQIPMALQILPMLDLGETAEYRNYHLTLTRIWHQVNYFRLLQKLLLKGLENEKFYIKPFLSGLIADSPFALQNKFLELEVELEDMTVHLDKDALRWITSLLLLNAENSLLKMDGPGKVSLHAHHVEFKFYLWVSGNSGKMDPDTGGDTILQCKHLLPKVLNGLGGDLQTDENLVRCMLPVAKNTVSPQQRRHIIREFEGCERTLRCFYDSLKDAKDLEAYSLSFYKKMHDASFKLFKRSRELSLYVSSINSDECPFNLFQGPPELANHTINRIVAMIPEEIGVLPTFFFDTWGDQRRRTREEIDEIKKDGSLTEIHEYILTHLKYSINCLKTFRKIATRGYVPERFDIRTFLEGLAGDRFKLRHHEYAKPILRLEDAIVEFDKEALYWMVMRMLSNAEHATKDLGQKGVIEVRTAWKDGRFYLVVRNNGMTIEERARSVAERRGGKSRPNIDMLCRDLNAEFILRDSKSKEFTVTACIRLPLAREQKWAK